MPKPIPFPIPGKEKPSETDLKKDQPVQTEEKGTTPNATPKNLFIPEESKKVEETPNESPKVEEIPNESPEKQEQPEDTKLDKDMPNMPNAENCVVIGENIIEIKPTKLKYFRNKAASAYGIIKAVPIHELLTYSAGVLDEKRDADQLLFDFLIAAFDDPVFVRDHYDEMTADDVEKVIKIFGRLNHIDEKEEAVRKNREAQAQAKR